MLGVVGGPNDKRVPGLRPYLAPLGSQLLSLISGPLEQVGDGVRLTDNVSVDRVSFPITVPVNCNRLSAIQKRLIYLGSVGRSGRI